MTTAPRAGQSWDARTDGSSTSSASGPSDLAARDETREERRNRREVERALRAAGADRLGSAAARRSAQGTGTGEDKPVTSSKSVLTIALQRAQSAVLLDSANNVPAAIAAYTQSVRLLKEVMARVAEPTKVKSASLGTQLDPDVARADSVRRQERAEKKERARDEESRRLQVIHDTYEDRIRMLTTMGYSLPDDEVDSPSPPTLVAQPPTSPSFLDSPTSSPPSSPFAPRRPASESSLAYANPSPDLITGGDRPASPSPSSSTDTLQPVALPPISSLSLLATSQHSLASLGPSAAVLAVQQEFGFPASDDERTPRNSYRPAQRDASSRPLRRDSLTPKLGDGGFPPPLPTNESGDDALVGTTESLEAYPLLAPRPLAPLERRPSPQLSEALAGRRRQHNTSVDLGVSSANARLPEEGGQDETGDHRSSLSSSRYRSDSSASSAQRTVSGDSLSSRATSIFSNGFSRLSTRAPPSTSTAVSLPSVGDPPSPQRPRTTRSASLAPSSTSATTFSALVKSSRKSEGGGAHLAGGDGQRVFFASSAASRQQRSPRHHQAASADLVLEEDERSSADPETRSPGAVDEFGVAISRHDGVYTRSRALSQPSKRPVYSSYATEPLLPVIPLPHAATVSSRPISPTLSRKMSMPIPTVLSIVTTTTQPLSRTVSNGSQTSFGTNRGGSSVTGSPSQAYSRDRLDGPPSSTLSTFPSRTSGVESAFLSFAAPPPFDASEPLVSGVRRPFYLMRLIAGSIETGGYITPRLYVPKELWSQAGVKLVALETKVRMLDLLYTGLDGFERFDELLLRQISDARGTREQAVRMVQELDAFGDLQDMIQTTLFKKLGYSPTAAGKKVNATSFSAWSSKLSRSLDRVTNGRSLDSPAAYVEGISRLFRTAQTLDLHLLALIERKGAYAHLAVQDMVRIEQRLRRSAEFFRESIVSFVLGDLGILLDKYLKRGAAWIEV